jgi:predicted secreted Zn-dependent protease
VKFRRADNCDEYKRVVAAQAAAVVRENERKQNDYDQRTRHGATQGAVWRSGGRSQR